MCAHWLFCLYNIYRPRSEGYVFTGICLPSWPGGVLLARQTPPPPPQKAENQPIWSMCGRYAYYWNAYLFNKLSMQSACSKTYSYLVNFEIWHTRARFVCLGPGYFPVVRHERVGGTRWRLPISHWMRLIRVEPLVIRICLHKGFFVLKHKCYAQILFIPKQGAPSFGQIWTVICFEKRGTSNKF